MEIKSKIEKIKELLAGYMPINSKRGVYAQAYEAIESLESELEALRAERDMLKLCADQNEDEAKKAALTICALRAEIDEYQAERDEMHKKLEAQDNHCKALSGHIDDLNAEREAMMKQKPAGYIVKDTKNNLEWLTTIQNPEKYKRDYPDFVLTTVYAMLSTSKKGDV